MKPEAQYLAPGRFIDSDAPSIKAFAEKAVAGAKDETARAIALYRAARESVRYDPYVDISSPSMYRASEVLAAGHGYCVSKAAVLAAAARAAGVPARVGYADVRNHMTSPRIHELMGGDVFRWHSYADLYVNGRWVKATPAFNASLCERLGVGVLEFDGRTDSLFQPFDRSGRRHMEYLLDRGTYADVPYETIVEDFRIHYPAWLAKHGLAGDFAAEAVTGEGET